jgi:hypothetical protein
MIGWVVKRRSEVNNAMNKKPELAQSATLP